jgi:hypothetical protein
LDAFGLCDGLVHVFPKLDGTNASVWLDGNGEIQAGSRSRVLSEGADDAGFLSSVNSFGHIDQLHDALSAFGEGTHIYGEWLVPHTIKGYREDAWRRFWIFDAWTPSTGYVALERYAPVLDVLDLDWIPPLATIDNPDEEIVLKHLNANTFLMADGAGLGEGVVLKNYDWKNKYGRQPWGKVVRNEFKDDARTKFGAPELKGRSVIEGKVAEKYVTQPLVDKIRAKIRLEIANREDVPNAEYDAIDETYRKEMIPRLLQTVYTDVVNEEAWAFVREFKDPTVNFKSLRAHVYRLTKKFAQDLF